MGVAVGTRFRPFVPRLAAEWAATAPDERWRAIEASLLGLDISGFTALSERLAERGKLGAEELISLISRCYSGLIDIAERYGGDVLKFRGDALLLLFDGDRHEKRAALAALAMQVYVAEAGQAESSVGPVRLSMASGLVTGPCHFFLVGRHHRELIVCGPTASRTLALEDAAEAGEVLVSPRTAEALVGLVAAPREGAFLLDPAAAPAELPPPPDEDDVIFVPELVPPLLRLPIEEDAVEAEHRHATAAFVKFSGTDGLVEDPGEAGRLLAELADVVSTETHDRSVTWLESDIDVDGGKLYLVAGAPVTGGDDEERMLRTVRAVVDAHAGPPIAVGVNRGRVVAGPIGSERRRTYAVMGDTVNLAARLAARAGKGEILTSGEVLERSRARFETTSRQFLMKGKARPVTGYSVGELAGEAADEAPLLPLVGRDRELAVLREALESARTRTSSAVELVGDAGAGKSRLLEELAAGATGFQVLRARCEAYSASTPFAPFRTLLRPLVGILPDESADAAGSKLTAFVTGVMPDLAQWLPLLALPLGADVARTPEVDEIEPAFRRDRLHDVLEGFLMRLLLMPTAILVEDTHWLDDASQLVLARLAQPGPRPWLVVTTRRPSGVPLGTRLLELEPLDPDDARRLALLAAGDTPLPEADLTALTERAAGNALFIRELASSSAGAGELPETVESLLTSRIDTLHPADRLLLRHASVIGPSFGLDLLEEILPDGAGDPDRWGRLADFVDWDGPSRLRFRHDLVHAAAYDGLSYAKRREIHALVGEAIERRSFDTSMDAEVLSLHFLAAPGHAPLDVAATVERAGRVTSVVSVRIEQDGAPQVLGLATLSALPETGIEWDVTERPAAKPLADSPPVPLDQAGIPAFLHNYDQRWARGSLPGEGRAVETGGWLRTADPRRLDAPLVAAMTDAWAPAAFAATGRFVAAPTLDLSIHVRRPLPPAGMGPAEWVLVGFESRLSSGGVWEEDGELWSPDGVLLAQSRQLALLVPRT